jgi:hypothetical protein
VTAATLASPVPTTVDVAEYADYPVLFYIGEREHPISHAATYQDAFRVSRDRQRFYGDRAAEIGAVHGAPDGRPVIIASRGGTWSGNCGSTRWIRDIGDRHRTAIRIVAALGGTGTGAWQPYTSDDSVSRSQAWWVNGLSEWDGFRVECRLTYRHDGPCKAEQWSWDQVASVPLPDLP